VQIQNADQACGGYQSEPGSAEGPCPFAERLGVSPSFSKSPKTGGFRGLINTV